MEKSFFSGDTKTVARDLIGCVIERNGMKAKIVETEAYLHEDPASHAYPEKTERNRLMYETYGYIYVYRCYGVHHMLNFTTERIGVGGVLVRALEPLEGVENMKRKRDLEEKLNLCNGPGKLCEALNIDSKTNGTKVGETIRLEKDKVEHINTSKRIGISKARERKLRFFEPGNKFVSDR